MRNLFCDNRHEKSANEQFLTELSKWVFHERGHLKVRQKLLSCRPDSIMFIDEACTKVKKGVKKKEK